ncbi:hypothetical protein KY285_003545 [Solanum tuberosum]|uniref:Uncharacterized protein n=1 Tax=Solanum tuberosum TaxID=4113 RepID=M1D8F3_SOLTU|nr:hypothetical protein KY284_003693 [Solanum tuberosum]KAH0732701.1 hypothetical protein KY289_003889 [Solanum tuberosum]KAH0767674.1 hypothetical protein KY285_003545 [Solanum tuberosum]
MAFKKINDVSCKDSTIATFVDFSDTGLVSRHKFKTSGSDRSKYFTYLGMARKSKSRMTLVTAISVGNIASTLVDELSHSGFKFGKSANSMNSSIPKKVNTLMVDTTDMDEKFAMMEKTIETLMKSIDDKNLQIAQLNSPTLESHITM